MNLFSKMVKFLELPTGCITYLNLQVIVKIQYFLLGIK